MNLVRISKFLYTGIFLTVLFFSFLQLDLLKRGVFDKVVNLDWVRNVISIRSNEACAGCEETASLVPDTEIAFKPERVVIKRIGIDLAVLPVPLVNGTWQVNEGVANYAEGTSLVNEKTGNVGLYGHAKDNAFLRIKDLLTGDHLIVYNKYYKAVYEVQSTTVISPDEVDVFYPTDSPIITLITCEGLFDEQRYMVKAKLLRIEKDR